MATPIRILTGVPICDGHDSAINTINLELIKNGVEVVYLGYHRSARSIARAAVQEDVQGIGISSYNGGHVEFFAEVFKQLKQLGGANIPVFGGGGATILESDVKSMTKMGVSRIFFAGTPLSEIVKFVQALGKKKIKRTKPAGKPDPFSDVAISEMLSTGKTPKKSARPDKQRVIGFAGPGGAGKTTLIDETVRTYLQRYPKSRIAILSHDPSIVGNGALLGDRATMIYSQDDRVFMRSLATRGVAGGLAQETERAIKILRACPFDLILIETVGVGQEAQPFSPNSVDLSVMVMSPDYGARLQLQKIVMLDLADVVCVNKSDLARAPTAKNEIEQRLAMNHRNQRVIATTAKNHGDKGVAELVDLIVTGREAGQVVKSN